MIDRIVKCVGLRPFELRISVCCWVGRTAFWLTLIGLSSGQLSSAGPITVSFQSSSSGGIVAHEAVRVNSDTFSNSIGYNSAPILAPFMAADGTGGRYAVHPDATFANLDWNYMALDGAGAFTFNSNGTTTFNGASIAIGTGDFDSAGTGLPLAAHSGQLTSALSLPGGLSLAAGTTIYSDLAGFRTDYNNAAHYWYDNTTKIEHRTYTGGTWAFFYQDPNAAGQYLTLAEYRDVVFDFEINYRTGTVTNSWTGTAVAANGLILPGSVSGYSLTSPINTTGILSNELTTPFTGFYGRFRDTFQMTFDVDAAVLVCTVPEPSSLLMFALGCLGMIRLRRRNEGHAYGDSTREGCINR